MQISLVLYSTSHCHLCEEAERYLKNIKSACSVIISIVDIAEQSELLEEYGLTIPVIKRLDNHAELRWPFDEKTIIAFICTSS